MNYDKVFNDVVNQHEAAMRTFKSGYSFDTKQKDILFNLEISIRKYQAEQLVDQNKVDALNKKISKRQTLIEDMSIQLEISKSVKQEDMTNDRK